MSLHRFVFVLAVVVAIGLPFGSPSVSAADRTLTAAVERNARSVVSRFFRTLNARRYERTCALLADAYFERRRSERRLCAVGLRVGFMWSQEIRWRISGVRLAGERVLVGTLADGAKGKVVLVPERGRLRILALESA